MKYVQQQFLKEPLCALQVFLCVLISRSVCTHAQLRGNNDHHHPSSLGWEFWTL